MDPRFIRWAAREDVGDEIAARRGLAGRLRGPYADGAARQSDPWSGERLATHGAFDNRLRHVAGDRESETLRSSGARVDRGVDAYELSIHGNKRAAGIARVDRRVGLNEEPKVADAK